MNPQVWLGHRGRPSLVERIGVALDRSVPKYELFRGVAGHRKRFVHDIAEKAVYLVSQTTSTKSQIDIILVKRCVSLVKTAELAHKAQTYEQRSAHTCVDLEQSMAKLRVRCFILSPVYFVIIHCNLAGARYHRSSRVVIDSSEGSQNCH